MNAQQENIPRLGRKESQLGQTFSRYISALTQFHLKRRETAATRRPVDNSSIEDPAPNVQTNRTSITTGQKSCRETAQNPTLPRATIYPFTVQPTQGKRANASCSCLSGSGLPTLVSTYYLYIRRCRSTLCAAKTIIAQSPLCPNCIFT